MATVKALLNKDREKKKGGYSLVIQIIHKRVRRTIYTPYVLKNEEYDPDKQQAVYQGNSTLTHKQVREINKYVERKKREVEQLIQYVASRKECFEAEDVIVEYHQKQSDKYLLVFMERLIEKKEQTDKMGLARALRVTLRSLQTFIGGGQRTVKFDDVTPAFVKKYEAYLNDKKLMRNTISFYLRNFRSVYNYAVESGVEMKNNQPFSKLHIRSERTMKRALKKEVIELIANTDLSDNKALERARDLFMFSFYTRGMSFVDIVYLKRVDIVDHVIYYQRHKTHQYMQVAVIPQLQAIIDKYQGGGEYLLPFLNEIDHPSHYKRYQIAYGMLYRNLKLLQHKLDQPAPLTMHVARHSWATIAKESGVHAATISQGLGHTSEKTTEIYLREFDNSIIDEVNARVAYFSMHV